MMAVPHATPSTLGLANITVASVGRATSVTDLRLEWMDGSAQPAGFGYGPLNRLDYGLTQDMGPAFDSLIGLDQAAWPARSPTFISDGNNTQKFAVKVYCHDPARKKESDQLKWYGQIRAKIVVANRKRPYFTETVPVMVTPM
jgi:hypothetical protein